jgi:hypothetical protein
MQPGDRKDNPHGKRPLEPLERYRLYLDESGDHVVRDFSNLAHRFLCLLGCWFRYDSRVDGYGVVIYPKK